jgi:hypothetical protein
MSFCDLLGLVGLDAAAHLDHLLDLVAAHLLRRCPCRGTHVDVALGELAGAGCPSTCCSWKSASPVSVISLSLISMAAGRALEVEAGPDLLGRVLDGVLHLDHVGLAHGIE